MLRSIYKQVQTSLGQPIPSVQLCDSLLLNMVQDQTAHVIDLRLAPMSYSLIRSSTQGHSFARLAGFAW